MTEALPCFHSIDRWAEAGVCSSAAAAPKEMQ